MFNDFLDSPTLSGCSSCAFNFSPLCQATTGVLGKCCLTSVLETKPQTEQDSWFVELVDYCRVNIRAEADFKLLT